MHVYRGDDIEFLQLVPSSSPLTPTDLQTCSLHMRNAAVSDLVWWGQKDQWLSIGQALPTSLGGELLELRQLQIHCGACIASTLLDTVIYKRFDLLVRTVSAGRLECGRLLRYAWQRFAALAKAWYRFDRVVGRELNDVSSSMVCT